MIHDPCIITSGTDHCCFILSLLHTFRSPLGRRCQMGIRVPRIWSYPEALFGMLQLITPCKAGAIYLVYNFPFCSMTRHNAICLFNSFSMTRIRPGLCIRARPCEKVLMNNCVCLWFWRNWHEILPRNDRENDLLVIIHTPRLTDCKEW